MSEEATATTESVLTAEPVINANPEGTAPEDKGQVAATPEVGQTETKEVVTPSLTAVEPVGANGIDAEASKWKDSLPVDLKDDPSLIAINDIETLAKSYIDTKRMIGADKIPVPGKHATDSDWKEAFHKLGLPKDVKDYEVTVAEGAAEVDQDMMSAYKQWAFDANVLPAQASQIVNKFNEYIAAQGVKVKDDTQKEQLREVQALQKEWGTAYQSNLARAQLAVKEYGDDAIVKYLNDTGLGNDANLIRLFANVGQQFSEGKILGEGVGVSSKTPKAAQTEIMKITADFDHPYHNSDHPNHKSALQEVEDLFAEAYPPS